MALLRVCEPDIRNRDIKLSYDTSYISELIPNVALSENTICTFLKNIELEYLSMQNFLRKRVNKFKNGTQIIDGTLKDYNSDNSTYSEFSRKGRVKGSKDISLMYSYDLKTKEPISMKAYAGNILDQRSIRDFVQDFSITNAVIVMDKGFYSKENISLFKSIKGLTYILPMKRDLNILSKYNMYQDINTPLSINEKNILYKIVKISDDSYLYSFRDPIIAADEEVIYLKKNKDIKPEKYEKDKSKFGVISFETNKDMSVEELFKAYESRWEIETLFKMFKDILDLDTENVHSDYSLLTTEFINYLSVIIAQRLRNLFEETKLIEKKNNSNSISIKEKYSFRQTMRYLDKIKMIRSNNGKWNQNYPTNTKYIDELGQVLDI